MRNTHQENIGQPGSRPRQPGFKFQWAQTFQTHGVLAVQGLRVGSQFPRELVSNTDTQALSQASWVRIRTLMSVPGGPVCVSECAKRCTYRAIATGQSELGEPAAFLPDPPALVSLLTWRRMLCALTSDYLWDGFIVSHPAQSQKQHCDLFLWAPSPCSCPHTTLLSLACPGTSCLRSWGVMFIIQ